MFLWEIHASVFIVFTKIKCKVLGNVPMCWLCRSHASPGNVSTRLLVVTTSVPAPAPAPSHVGVHGHSTARRVQRGMSCEHAAAAAAAPRVSKTPGTQQQPTHALGTIRNTALLNPA